MVEPPPRSFHFIRVVHTTSGVSHGCRDLPKCPCSSTTICDLYASLCHSGEMSMYLHSPYVAVLHQKKGSRWQSGNTLASHLCGRGSIPVMAVSGKAGSCLPLVGSLQYRTLANYMYWFPLPFQLPVVI